MLEPRGLIGPGTGSQDFRCVLNCKVYFMQMFDEMDVNDFMAVDHR